MKEIVMRTYLFHLALDTPCNPSAVDSKYINQICPPYSCQGYDEILYGVGFGIDYFRKISPRFRSRGIKNYEYRERSGKYGELPKTGGDIFVHAKCNNHGMLFDLAKSIIQNMPRGCVDKFEDIYGWTYRDGRDLSEFVDDETKEKWIGRTMKDSFELIRKPNTSHVARMVGCKQ
ncbi:unnamed protein product [Schistosoma margrebowiei]|uniref:Uncharacterized protein n=1 Tax=Schistosoma margrebowiei TaxID=48269 RepID=A0A183LBC4_9TREM|nr:unnamed protein product [Schistosoma margrebowiei]